MSNTKSIECLCVKTTSSNLDLTSGLVSAKLTAVPANLRFTGNAVCTINANNSKIKTSPVSISAVMSVTPNMTVDAVAACDLDAICEVVSDPTVIYSVNHTTQLSVSASISYADKFAGDFGDYECAQKLFPIADKPIDSGYGHFVGPFNQSSGLYDFIDEGVFTGDYDDPTGNSVLLADDKNSFIHPSAIHTIGQWQYKCEVTAPLIRPDITRLRLRASAPMTNVEAGIPPRYTIRDIMFEDPSGGLIAQYNDIVLRGDADYYDNDYVNFTTYSSNFLTSNVFNRHGGQDDFPILGEGSGYTLTFNVVAEALDDAFDEGFTEAFEKYYTMPETYASGNDHMAFYGSPLSSMSPHFINPTHSLKISAIEICNSGGWGPRIDNAINFYTEVRSTGNRIERTLYPSLVPVSSFSTNIWPDVTSVWVADSTFTSNDTTGTERLLKNINSDREDQYITLQSTSVDDSGKLTVKMTHGSNTDYLNEVTPGSFDMGFDGSGGACISNGAFNRENKNADDMSDHFFMVECVKLRVLAKKHPSSRDYYLDVVGYSDDKLLNVTSASGGFLQNALGGSGTYPVSSGFAGDGEIPFAGNAISDDDDYYETSGNLGGDHYLLTTSPLISGVGFQWYEIPLSVFDDEVTVGVSRDYSTSSMFENLYLDIYPIPSGASIAKLELLVRYKPQNAINLITEGGADIRKVSADDRGEVKIFPTSRQSGDDIINAGSGYAPLSTINNIPHAYDTPNTIKSNYSRRWRGMDGVNTGPFDPDQFSFSFEFENAASPFVSGFYDFENDDNLTIVPRDGSLSGYMTTSLSPYRFKNIGWRFQDNDIFSSELPNYSGAYKTTDWTSTASGATNFENHPLYGQIADASKNFIRLRGNDSYIDFGDIGVSGKFATYIRFTPDANVSGVGYDGWESGCLFSKWDSGSELEFALHYASGFLRGIARDTTGTIHTVQDSTPYTDYQYPLSVILTYSGGLRLYTDNEFESEWTTLRDSSSDFEMHVDGNNFIVGNCPGSGVGFNMFVSEIGISEHANVVSGVADKTYQQVTADTFLGNNRVFWWDADDTYTNDAYKIWQNVDEDTRVDWSIGAFKHCQFTTDFDIISKRTGRDLINFNITHDGVGYITNADLAMPSNVDSGVAYHTQIENDFLRFNLSDTDNTFYSTLKRISKDLPRGYKFAEDALVVETVIEHKSSGDIVWDDGNVGPKFIVSLYTKTKEPYWTPDEPNWGLINREIHYLEPSSCLMRVDSKFTYDSICNETEQWSLFPVEPRISEFKEKYFSDDVDDMFLQYDLVYPSGPAFTSNLDIHSAHIRMDNAYVSSADTSGTLNISTSGGYVVDENLNLYMHMTWEPDNESVNLFTVGPLLVQDSGMPFYTSGALILPAELNLFTENREVISVSGLNMVTSGKPLILNDASGTVNLHTMGKGVITSASGDQLGIALTAFNSDTSNLPDAGLLNMFMYASSGNTAIRTDMPIFLLNNLPVAGDGSGTLNLRTIGSSALFSRYPNGSMNLSILNDDIPSPSENMNLTLYGDNLTTVLSTDNINLYAANYGGTGSTHFRWLNNNYGTTIDVADNDYAKVPANAEIRGVDTIGYGSCTGNSPDKAIDPAIVTDDVVWREATCNEGGIFRGETTYTNTPSYSGNYYGIRKYTELLPNSPYWATMEIQTGSTESIRIPNDFEEWEYGITSDINYSGVKITADEPRTITPSGRNAGDGFGKTVAVKGDLMAIGSPFMSIPDESGHSINNAGSVFLYRRGADVPGAKAPWSFEDQIMLPEGYRRDYISATIENLLCYPNTTSPEFCVSGQRWNIGQEGREFGHSIDIASSGDSETLVIGAPGASWGREFDTVVESGVSVVMVVFVDQFTYSDESIGPIANTARKYDTLYKYFSAPWNAGGDEFQPKLDIKLLVCQLSSQEKINESSPVESEYDWFKHIYINRLDDKDLIDAVGETVVLNTMTSGIIEAFHDIVDHGPNRIHSGVPPILGVFTDNSPSTEVWGDSVYKAAATGFLSFYEEYSFASGVVNPGTMIPETGHVNIINGPSQSFSTDSVSLMNETLATGYLINNDALKFITSGVGQEWGNSNAYDFQIPAPSGGRVFVFEKESGVFNLVQEIKSGSERRISSGFSRDGEEAHYVGYGSQSIDRFGHSVSINQDGGVIAIGSPYSSTACEVFEKNPAETTRMYDNLRSWLVYRSKTSEVARYDNLVADSGVSVAKMTVYNELTPGDKFFLRSDELFWGTDDIIQPYKSIYSYSYGDIPSTGTWSFIPDEFAGTSRLGYSTAISEDGDIVAFGAPTDSFNEFDDTNEWYRSGNSWASYTNAGAVRMFESRKYYPHSGVVEFYKFGNLDRTMHPELVSSGYYDQMGLYFDDNPFQRTGFDDIEIPRDAGLAFIITPEVDAASEEIIDNIKNWLSLGDRTLVLVGNDPVWEDGGVYKQSNDIINKILLGLGSRMRLHPARNEYESLPNSVSEEDVASNKYNIVAAKMPAYSHGTTISRGSVFAKGVADIRIDLSDLGYTSDVDSYAPCDEYNTRCEMPLVTDGDLRAEWNSLCTKTVGNFTVEVPYKENWPRKFNNTNPSMTCDSPPYAPINRPLEDVTPVLTAAEYIPEVTTIIPASSGYVTVRTALTDTICGEPETREWKEFGEINQSGIEFYVSGVNNTIVSDFTTFSVGSFTDPDEKNDIDGILQGVATPFDGEKTTLERQVDTQSHVITQEVYYDGLDATTSRVYLMATMTGESEDNLNSGGDINVVFYNNLVIDTSEAVLCNSLGNIEQLGGWTGRESFKDAYSPSQLGLVLTARPGQSLNQGVDHDNEMITPGANVLWIAAPIGLPNDFQINSIKDWLALGDKKLVITYNNNEDIAANVTYICDALNLNSKPWYSESHNDGAGAYLTQPKFSILSSRGDDAGQKRGDVDIINGYDCPGFSTVIDNDIQFSNQAYIPINKGANTNSVVYYNDPLFEEYTVTGDDRWRMNANGSASFSVEPGSGYRIFVSHIKQGLGETLDVDFRLNGCSSNPEAAVGGNGSVYFKVNASSTDIHATTSVDVKAVSTDGLITIDINTNNYNNQIHTGINYNSLPPKTTRITGISGCLVPIEDMSETDPAVCREVPNGKYLVSGYWDYTPEREVVRAGYSRPIMTDNTKYCQPNVSDCEGKGGQLIEDGPVVVAEEYEHFSSFPAGSRRSKIILVSDSTIIQGQNPYYRNDATNENQRLIRSFYPISPYPISTNNGDRRFEEVQKIVSPERGSPAKYYAATSIAGNANLFGTGVAGNLSSYTDSENDTNPADISRELDPDSQEEIKAAIEAFGTGVIPDFGVYPRFSGVIDGTLYTDAKRGGGVPPLMEATGKDYLDTDVYFSGYPGDLFGYDISIHKDKLVVGAPFAAYDGESVVSWAQIEASGSGAMVISGNGGAGAVYYFERTGSGVNAVSEDNTWEFKQKIRPSSINVGLDGASISDVEDYKGEHNLTGDFCVDNALLTDQFGHSVSIDSDMLAVGAPNHDYETIHEHIFSTGTAFLRKEFNAEFMIHDHNYFDLGSSGVRIDQFGEDSGKMVLNNGAVFTFRHNMIDWANRTKKWTFAEKLNAQGYSDRNTNLAFISGCENDHFGKSVYLDRAGRGDSDYTLAIGALNHKYAVSGNHPQPLEHAGASYVFDAMLRDQVPTINNSGSWIDAEVFGDRAENGSNKLSTRVYQNTTGNPITYQVSGIVFSNINGDIFLEASGYDPSTRGFIAHRPYIVSVIGELMDGTQTTGVVNLFTSGTPVPNSGQMNLTMIGPSSAIVYNNMNMYTTAWNQINVGSGNTPFSMVVSGKLPTADSGIMNMNVSGTIQTTNTLNVKIRGK